MGTKTKIAIGVLVALIIFAVGRYTAPTKVRVETKTVTVQTQTSDIDSAIKDHKKVVIVETDTTDGTKQKVTTITDDKSTQTTDKTTDATQTTSNSVSESSKGESAKTTFSVLVGGHVTSAGTPVYGGAITRPIIGPINIGIFGLSDGVAGASIGLSF